ncbi:MAG: hypothetical protein IT462_03945 [Planctomycetes bacterium]|nr:hypothetical protein [Planctomycetota bacterium]
MATKARSKPKLSPESPQRREALEILSKLPDDRLALAISYLEYLKLMATRPDLAKLWAEEVDEPISAEEEETVKQSRAEFARGEGIPIDEAIRKLRSRRSGRQRMAG